MWRFTALDKLSVCGRSSCTMHDDTAVCWRHVKHSYMIAHQEMMVSAHIQCHYSTHHLEADGAAPHRLRGRSEMVLKHQLWCAIISVNHLVAISSLIQWPPHHGASVTHGKISSPWWHYSQQLFFFQWLASEYMFFSLG